MRPAFFLLLSAFAFTTACRDDPKTDLDTADLSEGEGDESGDAGTLTDTAGDDTAGDDSSSDDTGPVDADGDGVPADEDCDDADAGVGGPGTWYADDDGDGYGDASDSAEACEAPEGYVAEVGDCDDARAEVYPGAEEICDDLDNDCDATADEDAVDATAWYADGDADSFGAGLPAVACDAPPGHTAQAGDCDDSDPAVNPDAEEICNDIDDDCDGTIDIGAIDPGTYFADTDGDGFGDPDNSSVHCTPPAGWLADDSDCDDSDPAVNPDAEEICNGVDDDCSGGVDDGASDTELWYQDADEDTYGNPDVSVDACDAPSGYVDNPDDCDDTDAALTPENDCALADTGGAGLPDTGGGDRDGTYEGDVSVVISVEGVDLDECVGTVVIEVSEAETPQILGDAECVLTGALAVYLTELFATLEGDITTDPDVEGVATLGGDTAPWSGTFSDDSTLEGSFSGDFDVYGYLVAYEGAFTATR